MKIYYDMWLLVGSFITKRRYNDEEDKLKELIDGKY